MDLFRSWLELVHEFRSGQFWWLFALLACLADAYLLICFDLGLIEWINSLPALSSLVFDGHFAVVVGGFIVAAAFSWFYLLPLLVFPLWQRLMFELNWRLFPEYRNSPSTKDGWHWLPAVQQKAALANNAVLYAHCAARQAEINGRRLQLTCLLGILLFALLALCVDPDGTHSLLGTAIGMWQGLNRVWQLLLFFLLLPAIMAVSVMLGTQGSSFDPYIQLPKDCGEL